jgi:hypothetical protein
MTPALTHVRLLVDDFPACFRFYRDVLGLTPTVHLRDPDGNLVELNRGLEG